MTKLSVWKKACTVLVLCAATAIASPAQTFTTLYSFCSQPNCRDGSNPLAGLVQATNGNLYGTTSSGGEFNHIGTVFEITRKGTVTTLYSFCSQTNCTDGAEPYAGLVQATNGDLYGTTRYGGANNEGGIFEMTPNGALTTLYSFCSQPNCADGSQPFAGLVQATNGNLYGTTSGGGVNDGGTIFQITLKGALTTLYSFCSQTNCTDGSYPLAGLIQATNGNFYGTTQYGGANSSTGGTVFKITPKGTLTTLYSFCSQTNCTDGQYPGKAGLVQATNGNLYGTTSSGGEFNNNGTVFEITLKGALTTVYDFTGGDGIAPQAGLVQATNGNLYGTTAGGGTKRQGTVFQITPKGALTTVYDFTGGPDGSLPFAGLVQATNGNLYGATYGAGANGVGTIFGLDEGLGPFVTFVQAAGKVGQTGPILGQGLTGTTSVSLNGTPANFTVVSDTFITATVPAGATTGYVTVTTPSGTLTSNVPFHVIP